MRRDILHIRIDSFFASVEENRRPALRGKAVIVAAAKGSSSGVVVSVSEKARRTGVVESMSIRQAQRICPDAVILKANNSTYKMVFNAFLEIAARFSPLLEPELPASAYIDVSGCSDILGSAPEIAEAIARDVYNTLNLRVFTGYASNKLLARLASGMGRRLTHVEYGYESSFLAPLPISELDAVNPKIAKRLAGLGVSNISQLAAISEASLVRQFGPVGCSIKRQSMGIDFAPVKAAYPPETINIEHTFSFVANEPQQILEILPHIAQSAKAALRKRGVLAGALRLTLFDESKAVESAVEMSLDFKKPTDSTYTIVESLSKMLDCIMRAGMEVYRLEVVIPKLDRGRESQLCLLGDGEKKIRIHRAIEQLNDRFGSNKIHLASCLITSGREQIFDRVAL